MPHNCEYLITHCIDFRFIRAIKDYLEKSGILGDCDEVSVAGSVKDSNFILGQIDISARLHNIHEVVLINHLDCGAYGGSEAFGSAEEEYKFHVKELKKARGAVLVKYPSLKVIMLLAKIAPSGEVSFEEIKA